MNTLLPVNALAAVSVPEMEQTPSSPNPSPGLQALRTQVLPFQAPGCSLWSYHSPVGRLYIRANEKAIVSVCWQLPGNAVNEDEPSAQCLSAVTQPVAKMLYRFLEQYFQGEPVDGAHIPVDFSVGTPFQQAVWQALREIPRGSVCTYRQLAQRVGSPKAFRAVGQANGRNPAALLVPCHRVVAADGGLGGYMLGHGQHPLAIKQALLALEGAWPATATV
ncbi:MAG: methylated-DNA--[protein]-cysteine S-methyltransferase [Candidatus Melainabacteria bacterium]|nr:methylated-DNA--[protein]-cysteine S-methyltransferase [Candidatus Melainabacteria bacterium]